MFHTVYVLVIKVRRAMMLPKNAIQAQNLFFFHEDAFIRAKAGPVAAPLTTLLSKHWRAPAILPEIGAKI